MMNCRRKTTRIRVMVPLRHSQIIVKTFPYYKTIPDVESLINYFESHILEITAVPRLRCTVFIRKRFGNVPF